MEDKEYERLRKLAHDAPFNIYHENHDGHKWIEIVSRAWMDRSRELVRYNEKKKEEKNNARGQ